MELFASINDKIEFHVSQYYLMLELVSTCLIILNQISITCNAEKICLKIEIKAKLNESS